MKNEFNRNENATKLTPQESKAELKKLFAQFCADNEKLIADASAVEQSFDNMRRKLWVDELMQIFNGELAGNKGGNVIAIPDTKCGREGFYIYLEVHTHGINSPNNMNSARLGTKDYRRHIENANAPTTNDILRRLIKNKSL